MNPPEKLVERLRKLGLDKVIYEQRSRKCILSHEKLNLEQVPWHEHAFYIDENFDADRTDVQSTSYRQYYVFDPISLVPCLALEPKENESILDMCAAPGTKTYIISFLTNNKSRIIANDINKFRIRRLIANINRFHISAEVSVSSGRKLKGNYSRILLDAPCSGEGMVNKHKKMFSSWSEARIKILSKKQKKLIKSAFELLSEPTFGKRQISGGALVYSTCTFAPEENEEVVDFLLKKFKNAKLEKIEIQNLSCANGLSNWNGKQYSEEVSKCLRIYPYHNNTGGFFVAKIKKI